MHARPFLALVVATTLCACEGDTTPSVAGDLGSGADMTLADTTDALDADPGPDVGPSDDTADDVADATEAPDINYDISNDTTPDAAPDDTTPDDDAVADTGPVIDPNGDTDRDGIFDLDEVADGTDPFDPRSARAWHPEITGYPRLYTDAEARASLIALTTDDGDGAALWARIQSESDRIPPAHPDATSYNTQITPAQGHIAEAAAIRGWLFDDPTDPAYIVKSLGIIAAPYPDPTYLNLRSQFNAGDNYNLYESQALVGFCGAWDFARAFADAHPDAIDAALLDAAKARLTARINHFRTLCFLGGGCRALLRAEANNHTLKSLSALGVCAMALPDRPEAASDFNEALGAIDFIVQEVQGSAEGGWGENWNYLSYSGETHLAFFAAWHRHARGTTWPVRHVGWVMSRDPRAGTIRQVEDFATNALVRGVYRGAIYAAQPDGRMPPVDDGNISPLHGGLLAALFDDGIFRWNWRLPAVGRATGRTLVPTFASLVDAPEAVSPEAPLDRFLADAGYSIFRDSWDSNSLFLYMQHEPEKMRAGGQAHEHADNLSFLMHAFGEPLLIDPGYIDYSNHLLVKYAKDHNVVLVDGQGQPFWGLDPAVQLAPLGNARLHAADTRGEQTTVIASTRYFNAEVRRRIVRIGAFGFVMADRVLEAAGAPVTWQMNGYASEKMNGTSYSRREIADGIAAAFRWARPRAAIDVLVVAATGTAVAGDRLEENLNIAGRTEHRCATFEAPMGDAAGFLTLMVPTASGANAPDFAATRPAEGITSLRGAAGNTTVLAVLNTTGAAWQGVDADGQPVTVPAESLWVGSRTTSGPGDDGPLTTEVWSMVTPPIEAPVDPLFAED